MYAVHGYYENLIKMYISYTCISTQGLNCIINENAEGRLCLHNVLFSTSLFLIYSYQKPALDLTNVPFGFPWLDIPLARSTMRARRFNYQINLVRLEMMRLSSHKIGRQKA